MRNDNLFKYLLLIFDIEKKPVIDTLCWCTCPDASWRASSHANARQTSCKVVAAEARSVIVYIEREALTLFSFIVWIRCLWVVFPMLDHPYPSSDSFWWECGRELLEDLHVLSTHQHHLLKTLRK